MLSLAVASSAIAGPVKHVQKGQLQPSTSRMGKLTKAPVANNLNVQASDIKAPKVQKKQREMIPCEGLRLMEKQSLRAVVSEQPAGTLTQYIRSGKALTLTYNSGWYYTNADQGGVVDVVVNGNTIWFKNLLYDPDGYFDDYWIQGTKSGNTITIPMGQDIEYSSNYNAYIQLGWGSTYVSGGSLGFYHNANMTEATFTVNGDVLTLDGAYFTSNYTGMGLVAYWSDDDTYGGEALYNTTLTNAESIPEAPVMYSDADIDAMTGDLVQYYRTGYAIYRVSTASGVGLELGLQKGMNYIFFDADGETVYMRDPVYTWNGGGYWIKGTKDGNTLTFPLGQYIYWNDETFLGLKTSWGQFVQGVGYTDMPDVTEVTFTIENECIYMNNCGVSTTETDTTYVGLSLMIDSAFLDPGWFGGLDFYTEYYAIPDVPTNVTVDPAATTCDVAWTTGANSTSWNVRYREWVDPSTVDYFYCDFEGENDIDDWWGLNLDGDNYWWQGWESEDGNNYLGSASYINNVGALTPDNLLCSPELTLDGVVRFKAWGIDADWADEVFKVYIFVGDTATIQGIDDFIAISEDVTATGEATEYTFSIPEEYWGQQGYIAIRHYNVTNMYWLAIDDIYVGNADGGNPWIYVYDVEDVQTVLTGLTPETTYEVEVQGANYGGVGAWTEAVQFTTLAQAQPTIKRGDVDGDGVVGMGDLTALINYLVGIYTADDINFENAAVCDSMTGDPSEDVGMGDLTALINYLVYNQWDM